MPNSILTPTQGQVGSGGTGLTARNKPSPFQYGFIDAIQNSNTISLLRNLFGRKRGKLLDEDEFNARYSNTALKFVPGTTDDEYEDILIRHQQAETTPVEGIGGWTGYITGGIAAETLDPLNYIGVGLVAKGAKGVSLLNKATQGAKVGATTAAAPEVIKTPLYVEHETRMQNENPYGYAAMNLGVTTAFGAGLGGVVGTAAHAWQKKAAQKVVQESAAPESVSEPILELTDMVEDTADSYVNTYNKTEPNNRPLVTPEEPTVPNLSAEDIAYVDRMAATGEEAMDKIVVTSRTKSIDALEYLADADPEVRNVLDGMVGEDLNLATVRNNIRNTKPSEIQIQARPDVVEPETVAIEVDQPTIEAQRAEIVKKMDDPFERVTVTPTALKPDVGVKVANTAFIRAEQITPEDIAEDFAQDVVEEVIDDIIPTPSEVLEVSPTESQFLRTMDDNVEDAFDKALVTAIMKPKHTFAKLIIDDTRVAHLVNDITEGVDITDKVDVAYNKLRGRDSLDTVPVDVPITRVDGALKPEIRATMKDVKAKSVKEVPARPVEPDVEPVEIEPELRANDVEYINSVSVVVDDSLTMAAVTAHTRPSATLAKLAKSNPEVEAVIDELAGDVPAGQKVEVAREKLRETSIDDVTEKLGIKPDEDATRFVDDIVSDVNTTQLLLNLKSRIRTKTVEFDPNKTVAVNRTSTLEQVTSERMAAYHRLMDTGDPGVQDYVGNMVKQQGPLVTLNTFRRNPGFIDMTTGIKTLSSFVQGALPKIQNPVMRAAIFREILDIANGDVNQASDILSEINFNPDRATPYEVVNNVRSSDNQTFIRFDGDESATVGTADELIADSQARIQQLDREINKFIEEQTTPAEDIAIREAVARIEESNNAVRSAYEALTVCRIA